MGFNNSTQESETRINQTPKKWPGVKKNED